MPSPSIWVLKSFRAGDNAQAIALAHRVGGHVSEKQMTFNRLAALPNVLHGTSIRMLTKEAIAALQPPWPDLVIATGRRTAAVAAWVKTQSDGTTKIVQLGRPRLPLHLFDLIITTPQYGLPERPNVFHLSQPFVPQRRVEEEERQHFLNLWQELPRPWIVAVAGGAKFPLRLGPGELQGFGVAVNKLAIALGGSAILLASPRSPPNTVDLLVAQMTAPHWAPKSGAANAYGAALALGDFFCVTADSVSMVAEMLATRKPVYAFRLPQSRFMPRWKAQSGLGSGLVQRGFLSPPRNVLEMTESLMRRGILGDLAEARAPSATFSAEEQYHNAVMRVRSLIGL